MTEVLIHTTCCNVPQLLYPRGARINLGTWIRQVRSNANKCSQHGTVKIWLVSKWPRSGIPFPKLLIWWEYTVYRNVMLQHIIRLPGLSIKQGTLHNQLNLALVFKSNRRVLPVTCQCVCNGDETVGNECAVLLHLTVCLFIPVLTGIKYCRLEYLTFVWSSEQTALPYTTLNSLSPILF
jgi:hypothetical protein